MFLTKSQADARLNNEKNLARASFLNKELEQKVTITEKVIKLPGQNRNHLSVEERNEIALRTRLGESQTEVAREKGLVTATVSNIERGKTKGIDEEKVESIIDEVKDRALSRLMSSLGLLTDDKLSGCSAKDLSVIASNMGRVVEKIQSKVEQPDNINLIIYAPELKQERAFKVVEV